VALLGRDRGVAGAGPATENSRLDLAPGRAFGRRFQFKIARPQVEPRRPLYAQAVLLDAALYGPSFSLNLDSVATLKQYRAAAFRRVAGVSQPVHLNGSEPERQAPQHAVGPSVYVSLFHSDAMAGDRHVSRIGARLTNNSEHDVYTSLDLFRPIDGWPGKPSMLIESAKGERIGTIDGGQSYWPRTAYYVCRLPPGAFIECELNYQLPDMQSGLFDADGPRAGMPKLQLIDVPALIRDSATETTDVVVPRPTKGDFSRLAVPPSNAL
jgi:hypothetical protein